MIATAAALVSELLAYAELGVRHILDPSALDHVLFLVVLAAAYRPSAWRRVLVVVSAFTVGHSLSLALAVTGQLPLSPELVEFLIPVTIVVTALENLRASQEEGESPARSGWRGGGYRPLLAGVFGIVHGAGFAGYLTSLFLDDLAVPLLGFNLGIEAGQLLALAAIATVVVLLDAAIRSIRRVSPPARVRWRAAALSLPVALVATRWAVERAPW